MFSIIKKTANVWHHTNDTQTVHLSSFGVVADITAQTFILRALNGSFFPREAVLATDVRVIDETDSGTIETFANIDELLARLIQLQYPPYKTSGGGGGGAVDSVNGQTGVVVLNADDISDSSTTKKFVSSSEKNTWNSKEDAITAGTTEQYYRGDKTFQALNISAVSGLQSALDAKTDKTNWVDISLTSTIVGFASFAQRNILYKIVDNMAFVVYYIEGVSNSANFSFTVPNNSTQGSSVFGSCGYNVNNNSVQSNPARVLLPNNSNVVTVSVNLAGSNYVASGIKACAGYLIYKIN